ncbi:MAG: RDD family protein [Ilumatobacter sp.]
MSDRLLAARWRRIVGRLIDLVMWAPVLIGFGYIAIGSDTAQNASATAQFALAVVATAGSTILIVIYEVVLTLVVGGTLGKKMVGTRVVGIEGDAELDARRLMLRMSPFIATSLLSVVPILGVLTGPAAFVIIVASVVFLYTDGQRQAVWDKAARTIVVLD